MLPKTVKGQRIKLDFLFQEGLLCSLMEQNFFILFPFSDLLGRKKKFILGNKNCTNAEGLAFVKKKKMNWLQYKEKEMALWAKFKYE